MERNKFKLWNIFYALIIWGCNVAAILLATVSLTYMVWQSLSAQPHLFLSAIPTIIILLIPPFIYGYFCKRPETFFWRQIPFIIPILVNSIFLIYTYFTDYYGKNYSCCTYFEARIAYNGIVNGFTLMFYGFFIVQILIGAFITWLFGRKQRVPKTKLSIITFIITAVYLLTAVGLHVSAMIFGENIPSYS